MYFLLSQVKDFFCEHTTLQLRLIQNNIDNKLMTFNFAYFFIYFNDNITQIILQQKFECTMYKFISVLFRNFEHLQIKQMMELFVVVKYIMKHFAYYKMKTHGLFIICKI